MHLEKYSNETNFDDILIIFDGINEFIEVPSDDSSLILVPLSLKGLIEDWRDRELIHSNLVPLHRFFFIYKMWNGNLRYID